MTKLTGNLILLYTAELCLISRTYRKIMLMSEYTSRKPITGAILFSDSCNDCYANSTGTLVLFRSNIDPIFTPSTQLSETAKAAKLFSGLALCTLRSRC